MKQQICRKVYINTANGNESTYFSWSGMHIYHCLWAMTCSCILYIKYKPVQQANNTLLEVIMYKWADDKCKGVRGILFTHWEWNQYLLYSKPHWVKSEGGVTADSASIGKSYSGRYFLVTKYWQWAESHDLMWEGTGQMCSDRRAPGQECGTVKH